MENKEITLIDYLLMLTKWRKFLFLNFLIVCVLAAAISLTLPKWYTSSTTILPPTGETSGLGISSLINNLPVGGLGLGMGALSEEASLFLAIINSRTVLEAAIEKFDLMDLYGTENMEETLRALRDHISVNVNDEGTITFYAEAGTPFLPGEEDDNKARILSRDMADFFIQELDKVNKRLKSEKAKNTRIFIEKRYFQNLSDLRNAEEAFKKFQEQHGVIALPEQTAAAITTAAGLKAEIIAKETKIEVLKTYVSSSHSELLRAKTELLALSRKLDELKYGTNDLREKKREGFDKIDLFLPFDNVPDVGIQYARLFREVTIQEKLLEFLMPQYEQAKIQEAKDTPTVQVLDPAKIPVRKSKPKRAIIVLVAGMATLMILIASILLYERFKMLKEIDEEKYNKIQGIIYSIKKDLRLAKNKNIDA